MTNIETIRVHNADGSATDIIKKTRTRQTWFGEHTDVEIERVHKTKQQLEDESKANMIAGGIVLAGTLLVSGLVALLGSDDK